MLKSSEIRRASTEVLIRALGPIGMARYLEEYDHGGSGDYTKEKYRQPEFSIDDIYKNEITGVVHETNIL